MISVLKIMFTAGVVLALTLLVVELIVSKVKGKKVYTLADSLTNLSCGMIERSFDVFWAVMLFFVFNYIYMNFAPWQIPAGVITWIVALLVTDLLAYWHHRKCHEINALWAAHIVHHQSEELNISTVFRVSFFAVITRTLFFIWMPFIGFDPLTIASTAITLGIYQFLTHSRLVGKLGVLEIFMTTPSHHRVHHARNPKYLDKNYGHIFIFWDKLFGTFMEEEEEPDYGITSGFESSNAFTAQFSYWKNLFIRASRTKGIKNKANVFFKGPEYTPDDVDHLPPEYKVDEKGKRINYRQLFGLEKSLYTFFSVVTTFGFFFLLTRIVVPKPEGEVAIEDALNYVNQAYDFLFQDYVLILIGLILFSVFSHGYFMDQKKGAGMLDIIRLIAVAIIIPFVFSKMGTVSSYLSTAIIVMTAFMALWLLRIKWFDKQLSSVKR